MVRRGHPVVNKPTKKSRKVYCFDKNGELVTIYDGMSQAARATGVKVQNIYKTCNGYKTLLNNFYFSFESGSVVEGQNEN